CAAGIEPGWAAVVICGGVQASALGARGRAIGGARRKTAGLVDCPFALTSLGAALSGAWAELRGFERTALGSCGRPGGGQKTDTGAAFPSAFGATGCVSAQEFATGAGVVESAGARVDSERICRADRLESRVGFAPGAASGGRRPPGAG